jgi:uncharacterized circularly permuted ATP-grasp superfamily protein/uncharacterized alpha-E superfamily protein
MDPAGQLAFAMSLPSGLDEALGKLVAGYRREPGLCDELIGDDGLPRPRWIPLLRSLAALGPEELRRRFDKADRHLAEAGVVYRVYGDPAGAERPWPLDHLPLVVEESDWAELSAGIVERAELLENILADLYGPGRLVADGHLPAALVAGNQEFLRPLVGVPPLGGHYLHVYAADVSRGPDGRWWVIADRTQAPSGAGYAIENRVALSRALPDQFRDLNVDRLAAFYQRLRKGIATATGRDEPRVALLSPGAANETYFEHAYLARALGFLLVEGGDLTIRDDAVHVRTVEGPIRVDAILRRLDADFADPLELNAQSRLGVPGLVEAVRAGHVLVANALGSGLVEMPALLAFLPALATRMLGRRLALPNLATWWCGDEQARRTVLFGLEHMAILPAFGRSLRSVLDSTGVSGGSLAAEDRRRLIAAMERRGMDFIGQEPVRLGTTPVFENGRLVPKPFSIRVYAARTPDGWTVMPGGLGRITDEIHARSISMQRGGRSVDVWVLSARPVEMSVLIPDPEDVEVRRDTGLLPSRAADNLFWLGRYLERAEATLRLVRSLLAASEDAPASGSPAALELAGLLAAWGAVPFGLDDPGEIARAALHGETAGAVPQLLREARRTAGIARDRLSADAFATLSDLVAHFPREEEPVDDEADMIEAAEHGLRTIAAFMGLVHESMYRPAGWRFLKAGMRLERAIAIARFTRRLAHRGAPADCLGRLLDLTDAQPTYRARYLTGPAAKPVIDLVLLDDANPRSVAFQVERLTEHLGVISNRQEGDRADAAERFTLRLSVDLQTADPGEFDERRIARIEEQLMLVSDAVTRRYFGDALPGDGEIEADPTPGAEPPPGGGSA